MHGVGSPKVACNAAFFQASARSIFCRRRPARALTSSGFIALAQPRSRLARRLRRIDLAAGKTLAPILRDKRVAKKNLKT